MENIRSRCNLIVDLSNFTFNKMILSKVAKTNFVVKLCHFFFFLFFSLSFFLNKNLKMNSNHKFTISQQA